MTTSLRVLFIEDSDDDTALQVRLLRQAGYEVSLRRVETPAALSDALENKWDIIISDYSMPHFRGTDALELVRQKDPDVPFIFVSGTIGEEVAVAALKVGAQDYLMKTNLNRFIAAVERELREAAERRERRRLEQKIHQLQRFEAIGRLAGGVAHDFNNVLAAIMAWADMGVQAAAVGTDLQHKFLKIRTQADRAAALTRQLLAFARRQVLQPCNTNLNELTRETISLLKSVIGEHIEIAMELADDLVTVWADPGQIEQVLMNLCLNARDAMPQGGQLLIETTNAEVGEDYKRLHPYAVPGGYALLRVSDTGTGMDATTLEHVFEPFFSTKETGKGTGLGLATVYGIVKQHKGFIDVDSAPGQGATFRVYLPPGQGPAAMPEKRHAEVMRRGNEGILIAEDNEGLRQAVQEILESLGYRIFPAKDGADAIRLFGENRASISLVFLDVVMPQVNGPEAYARISSIKPGVPVIFTTGYASETNLISIRGHENAVILQKPYGSQHLAQKLREMLDKISE